MYKNIQGYQIIAPRINDRYEPLFSIYSKECLKSIKELLDKKIFKVSELFSKVKVREISEEEVLKFISPEIIFTNINSPEDMMLTD
jgi:molybdopterin-guanine dinucleotide biosynthesis protein A